MAKTMARLKNNIVDNLEWVDSGKLETDDLKDVYDLYVEIGDVYTNEGFYRNGVKLLSARETIRKTISEYDALLTDVTNVLNVHNPLSGEVVAFEARKQIAINISKDMIAALKLVAVEPNE